MSRLEGKQVVLAAKFMEILPHLDKRQRRFLKGAEARSLGHGGTRVAAGVREATVSVGMREPDSGEAPLGRICWLGGGRKRVVDLNPAVREVLLTLVEPPVRSGPPCSSRAPPSTGAS